jgi:hypothetical protein
MVVEAEAASTAAEEEAASTVVADTPVARDRPVRLLAPAPIVHRGLQLALRGLPLMRIVRQRALPGQRLQIPHAQILQVQ